MPRRNDIVLAAIVVAALGAGLGLWAAGQRGAADVVWAVATALVLVPLVLGVLRSLLRGDVGVDAIALVAIAGSLVLGEYLAGAIIALATDFNPGTSPTTCPRATCSAARAMAQASGLPP